jgi:hypothetical protein
MRWTRTVFDARAMIGRGTEKPFGFEVPALFYARVDGRHRARTAQGV